MGEGKGSCLYEPHGQVLAGTCRAPDSLHHGLWLQDGTSALLGSGRCADCPSVPAPLLCALLNCPKGVMHGGDSGRSRLDHVGVVELLTARNGECGVTHVGVGILRVTVSHGMHQARYKMLWVLFLVILVACS